MTQNSFDIGYVLGFSPGEVISKTSTAEREADLKHGFHDLYVYCDIIQPQFFGDSLVPQLRIIPAKGKDRQRISKSFLRPQYVPVSRKQPELKTELHKSLVGAVQKQIFGNMNGACKILPFFHRRAPVQSSFRHQKSS